MVIKVLHVGLGPVGTAVVRQVASRKGMQIVGAVDIDPAKAGRELGAVCAMRRKLGVIVGDDVVRAIKSTKPDIAVICTESSLRRVFPQFEQVLKLKVPIISTAEELAYPVLANRAIARKIDALARRSRVAVLGTGVNPGFAMDALPIALTSVCERVDSIEITRVQAIDRPHHHVGLVESITMIADALGWRLDRVTDETRARLGDDGVERGTLQDGVGYVKNKPRITLHMEMLRDVSETYDEIHITGVPSLTSRITSGLHGDAAAAAITVNAIHKVLVAQPGLRTMKDMGLPGFFGG